MGLHQIHPLQLSYMRLLRAKFTQPGLEAFADFVPERRTPESLYLMVRGIVGGVDAQLRDVKRVPCGVMLLHFTRGGERETLLCFCVGPVSHHRELLLPEVFIGPDIGSDEHCFGYAVGGRYKFGHMKLHDWKTSELLPLVRLGE